MTDRITAITDLIDAALAGNDSQHTSEASYGDDFGNGACWRCAEPAADDSPSGLCSGCRAFLLEDTEVDPATGQDDLSAGIDFEARLEPDDGQPRLPGPIPESVEASFPGYAPVPLSPHQWRLGTNGWHPGPVRFRHTGGGRRELVIGHWLSMDGERLCYTIFYQPVMLDDGRDLEVSVSWPAFGDPPGADTVVRLFVDQPRRIAAAPAG